MTTQAKIGTELAFDQVRFNERINFYRGKLLPAISAFASAFEQLNIGEFTPEVFKKSIRSAEFIKTAYSEAVEEDIERSKMRTSVVKNTFLAAIEADLRPVMEQREAMISTFDNASSYSMYGIHANWSDVSIIDGEPVVFPEQLKKEFTTVIETQEQLESWQKVNEFKKQYDSLVKFLKENNLNPHGYMLHELRGMMNVDQSTGYLVIEPTFIAHIKSAKPSVRIPAGVPAEA